MFQVFRRRHELVLKSSPGEHDTAKVGHAWQLMSCQVHLQTKVYRACCSVPSWWNPKDLSCSSAMPLLPFYCMSPCSLRVSAGMIIWCSRNRAMRWVCFWLLRNRPSTTMYSAEMVRTAAVMFVEVETASCQVHHHATGGFRKNDPAKTTADLSQRRSGAGRLSVLHIEMWT